MAVNSPPTRIEPFAELRVDETNGHYGAGGGRFIGVDVGGSVAASCGDDLGDAWGVAGDDASGIADGGSVVDGEPVAVICSDGAGDG